MKNNERDERKTRKVLVPLATLAVAAAVAVGSGATWTSSTSSSVKVSAGHILHTNSEKNATLTVSNLKPGDEASGSLTITNTGSIDSKLSITESAPTNGFFSNASNVSDLHLKIYRDGTEVYNGDFGEMTAGPNDITLGNPVDASTTLSTDDETTITFVVSLSANANDLDQKAKAGATYTFSTTPVDGQTGLSGIWN